MTESNVTKNVAVETKSLESKAKKALVSDTTKKVAAAGVAGFAGGFMTVLGTVVAQKMVDKLEERKTKKMLKKAESKKEATVTGELVPIEEVEN